MPFFVFDGRFALSGAQPQEVFARAMEMALKPDEAESIVIAVAVATSPRSGMPMAVQGARHATVLDSSHGLCPCCEEIRLRRIGPGRDFPLSPK